MRLAEVLAEFGRGIVEANRAMRDEWLRGLRGDFREADDDRCEPEHIGMRLGSRDVDLPRVGLRRLEPDGLDKVVVSLDTTASVERDADGATIDLHMRARGLFRRSPCVTVTATYRSTAPPETVAVVEERLNHLLRMQLDR